MFSLVIEVVLYEIKDVQLLAKVCHTFLVVLQSITCRMTVRILVWHLQTESANTNADSLLQPHDLKFVAN